MLTRKGSSSSFLAAVAIVAAALGDPLVETLANSGAIGRGYSDNNHLSVIPTLIAGFGWIVLAICAHCIELCRHSEQRRRWLIDTARQISSRSPLHDLPYLLILQFAALFIMESTEQLLFGGRLLGGTAWLGGPVVFSVLIHALIGAVCLITITRVARSIVKRFARMVGVALDFILLTLSRQSSGVFARRVTEPAGRRAQVLHVCQIGERAPPYLLLLT